MDTNRNFDVLSSGSSSLHMPSGSEVESAALHVPVSESHMLNDHTHDSSWKDRIYHIKRDASSSFTTMQRNLMSRVSTMQRDLSSRVASMKPVAQERMTSMRSSMMGQWSHIQSEMRSNPSKWAGIAAGAGLGVGIIGRIMRHRARHNHVPSLLIIESAC